MEIVEYLCGQCAFSGCTTYLPDVSLVKQHILISYGVILVFLFAHFNCWFMVVLSSVFVSEIITTPYVVIFFFATVICEELNFSWLIGWNTLRSFQLFKKVFVAAALRSRNPPTSVGRLRFLCGEKGLRSNPFFYHSEGPFGQFMLIGGSGCINRNRSLCCHLFGFLSRGQV